MITLNGEPVQVPEGTTVAELVDRLCDTDRGVAVALDREVVPRSSWTTQVVPAGARVEIVTAAAGG
jgi:sulfur carrier protein